MDRGARRAAADHASALEYLVEEVIRARARVGVDDVPLATTIEPHGRRLYEISREGLSVGKLCIMRMQHRDIHDPALPPRRQDPVLVEHSEVALPVIVATGGWHDDKAALFGTASQLDEPLHDTRSRRRSTADDNERAGSGAVFGGLLRSNRS